MPPKDGRAPSPEAEPTPAPPREDPSAAARGEVTGPEGAPIGELVGQVVRRIVTRGRAELEKAAQQGRMRLELRQLQRDRDAFWIRMGKTAYRLVEGGEIDHPALRKAMKRIDELERQIADYKKSGIKPEDAAPGAEEGEES